MDSQRILGSLSLGGAVAEHEYDLASYFIKTPDFQNIIEGRHDLVLGPKGSGKSAMFRVLMDPNFAVPELVDTVVIPALADDEVVLLRQLFEEGTPESAFQLGWKGFFAALAANYLVDNDLAPPQLESTLGELGLRLGDEFQWRFWQRFMKRMRTLFAGLKAQGELEVPFTKAKISISSELPALEDDSPSPLEYERQILSLMHIVDRAFRDLDVSCWIIIDRLDEVFAGRGVVEGAALRGLLRAQSDLHSASRVLRVKTFLRNDVLSRVTRDAGFTNLTHLRTLNLDLSPDSMAEILQNRLSRNKDFSDALPRDSSRRGARDAVGLLLPERMPIGRDYKSGFVWLYHSTKDGSNYINPRNAISLLEEAILRQRRVFNSGQPKGRPAQGHLLSGTVCATAYAEISNTRLTDTLYAENPHLRHAIDQMKYDGADQAKIFLTMDEIRQRLNLADHESKDLVEQLVDCGFLGPVTGGRFQIAAIYRPALARMRT
jgi:hypothetical protein